MKNSSHSKKVFIYKNACQRRSLDAKKFSTYFSKNNYKIVDDPKEADYIIFVTCAFINDMADQCLNTIKKFKKYNAELIVAGCLPDIAGEKLRKVFNGKTITTKDMDKIDEIFKSDKIKCRDVSDEHSAWHNYNLFGISSEPVKFFKKILKEHKSLNKVYKFLKENVLKKYFGDRFPFYLLFVDMQNENSYILVISRGCIHNCSYCAIKKAVGPLKSKPVDQCVKEFKDGLKQGYSDFILDADDIGIYGIDIKSNLPELLDKITKIEGNYSITLENTHPKWIIKYAEELEEILKRKKIKSILLSIQSGNNRILKIMRRSHEAEALIDTISRLKKAYSGLEIRAHFLVGFPTETIEEFMDTVELIKKIHFDGLMLFLYSDVDGTEASNIEPKVTMREMRKRRRIARKALRKTKTIRFQNR